MLSNLFVGLVLVVVVVIESTFGDTPISRTNSQLSILANTHGAGFKQNSECGGVLEGSGGAIVYKLFQNMTGGEKCVWTIVVPRKETIKVQLLNYKVYGNYQGVNYLNIFNQPKNFRNEFNLNHTFTERSNDLPIEINGGSVIQLTLANPPSWNYSTGFILTFEGVGPDSNYSDWRLPSSIKTYKQYDGSSTGIIRYPEAGNVYRPRELVLLTIHPEEGKKIALTLDAFNNKPYIEHGCYYTSQTLVITEIVWGSIYPNYRFRECRPTSGPTTIYSTVPLVLTYFTTHRPDPGYFQLSWKMVNAE